MTEPWNPFDWLSRHWTQMVGWSIASGILYKVYRVVQKLLGSIQGIEETRSDLRVLMTNHLPHLQTELEEVNSNISGLRSDLKDGLGRLSDSINVVLTRIE